MLNKDKYINTLNEVLIENSVKNEDRIQVIEDYSDLYDQGIEQGLTDEQVYQKLGNQSEIYKMIRRDLKHEYKTNKATSLMVFVSLIIFIILGNVLKLWEYSWLAFTLIPITGVITSNNGSFKKMLPGLMTFVALIIYFILGNAFDIYHPLWVVFLLIPIAAIISNTELSKMPVAISPFIAVIIYILISYFYNDFYKIGWLIFLAIPFIGALTPPLNKYKYGLAAMILLSIVLYLLIIQLSGEYRYGLFIFLLPISFALLTVDTFIYDAYGVKISKFNLLPLLVLLITIGYFIVSISTEKWEITWVILLLIPIVAIYTGSKFKYITPYMPFISLITFILIINYVSDSSNWAWLVFLSIPMTAIIEGDKKPIPSNTNRTKFDDDNDSDDEE